MLVVTSATTAEEIRSITLDSADRPYVNIESPIWGTNASGNPRNIGMIQIVGDTGKINVYYATGGTWTSIENTDRLRGSVVWMMNGAT